MRATAHDVVWVIQELETAAALIKQLIKNSVCFVPEAVLISACLRQLRSRVCPDLQQANPKPTAGHGFAAN